jgi:cobalt-zinc-cadmium efflux system outer membrane protein
MRLLYVAVLAAVSAAPAMAQEIGAPLSLRAAIAEALEVNPELVALRQEYEAMRSRPAQEGFLSPPMFDAQIWGWPVTTLNPARTDMYMFMGQQELPGRGKRAARALVAEREADVSLRQIAVRANQILDELKEAYADLAVARETDAIYERQAPLLQDLTEAAALRYAAGRSGQSDTVTSLVELTRFETERISVIEREELAEARLNALLGRPQGNPIGPLASTAAPASAAQLEATALDGHPELAMADAAVAVEEAALARLRSDRRPDFVVGGGYMLTPGGAGAWTARAGISWPNAPWSRGRLDAAIDVQEKRVIAAEARSVSLRTILSRAVREAAIRLSAAERRARLIESTTLPQVEHAFELARIGYAAGEGAFPDVLETQRMLLATEIQLAEARADVSRARAELDAAVGRLSAAPARQEKDTQ